jgi:tetratricopeptide (TPR) repeat protein
MKFQKMAEGMKTELRLPMATSRDLWSSWQLGYGNRAGWETFAEKRFFVDKLRPRSNELFNLGWPQITLQSRAQTSSPMLESWLDHDNESRARHDSFFQGASAQLASSLLVGLGLNEDGTLGDIPATDFQSIWATGMLGAASGFDRIDNIEGKFAAFCAHAMNHLDVPHLFIYCEHQQLTEGLLNRYGWLPKRLHDTKLTSVCWQQGDRWMDEARAALDGELSGIYLVKLGTSIEDFQTLLDALRVRAGKVPLHARTLLINRLGGGGEVPFVGREELLDAMQSHYAENKGTQVLLHGPPGVGKSRLASAFVRRCEDASAPFQTIIWVNVNPEHGNAHLARVYEQLAVCVGTPVLDARQLEELDQTVHDAISTLFSRHKQQLGRVLWVLDNLDNETWSDWCVAEDVQGQQKLLENHDVLSTSRRVRGLVGDGRSFSVPPFEDEDGVAVLTCRMPQRSYSLNTAQQIVEHVGGLPLALVLLAYCLEELIKHLGSSNAMENLWETLSNKEVVDALEGFRNELCDPLVGSFSENEIRGITRAFEVSYDLLDHESQNLAHELAYLGPEPFPGFLVEQNNRRAFLGLQRQSILIEKGEDDLGKMHRLQASFLRDKDDVPRNERVNGAVERMMRFLDVDLYGPEFVKQRHLFDGLLPHALELVPGILDLHHEEQLVFGGELLEKVTNYQKDWLAEYQEAQYVLEGLLRVFQKVLGENHPNTLSAKHNLAYVLSQQGAYKEAQEMYEEVLTSEREMLRENHPNTLTTKHNLASVLSDQGAYKEAQEMYKEVLSSQQKVLGENHPNTLNAKHSLAVVLSYQIAYKEAKEIHEEVLSSQQKVLGENHPSTLTTKLGLAFVISKQGAYKEAQEIYEEVLSLQQKVLGEDHPSTLTTKYSLAGVLSDQEDYKEAQEIHEEVLSLQQKVLGENHPGTLTTKNSLAGVLSYQGAYKEARKIYEEVLASEREVLGEIHPNTLITKHNLADMLSQQGAYKEAKKIYEEVLASEREVLGEDHPSTLSAKYGLAFVISKQGAYKEAQEIYEEVLSSQLALIVGRMQS